MKHLPKHIRPRWRYLGVELETWPDADVDRRRFQRALWYAAGNLLGDPGSAACDLSVYRFTLDASAGEGDAVIRARHGQVDAARAALACLTDVDGHPIGLRVRGVSGTVRACEESYLGGAGGPGTQRDVAFDGAEWPAVQHGDAVDIRTDAGPVGATRHDLE